MSRFGGRSEGGNLPRRLLGYGFARLLLVAAGVLALACVLLVCAALSSKAAAQQRVHTGKDGVSVTGTDQEIRAGGDCAYVRNGEKVIKAGNCKGTPGGAPKAHPKNTGPQTSAHHEQTTQQSTMLESTSPKSTLPTSMETTLPGSSTLPETTSSDEMTLPETTMPQELTTTLPGETTSLGGASCPNSAPNDSVAATVSRAVDGDTVKLEKPVEGKDTVRFIGVDTPELKGKNGEPEPGALKAKTFTAKSLEGKRVLLDIGKDPEDDYGRLLAYVWVQQNNKPATEGLMKKIGDFVSGKDSGGAAQSTLFEKTLLKGGYARVMTVAPNDKYADCLKNITHSDTTSGVPPSGPQYEDTTDGATPPTAQYEDKTRPVPPESATEQSTPHGGTTDRATSTQYVDQSTTLSKTTPDESAMHSTMTLRHAPEQTTTRPEQTATHQQSSPTPPVNGGPVEPSALGTPAPPLPSPASTMTSTSNQPSPTAPFPAQMLPTHQTANGPVAVLPDTGGPKLAQRSAPTLMLGVGLLILGASGLLLAGQLRPGERANGRDRREP